MGDRPPARTHAELSESGGRHASGVYAPTPVVVGICLTFQTSLTTKRTYNDPEKVLVRERSQHVLLVYCPVSIDRNLASALATIAIHPSASRQLAQFGLTGRSGFSSEEVSRA